MHFSLVFDHLNWSTKSRIKYWIEENLTLEEVNFQLSLAIINSTVNKEYWGVKIIEFDGKAINQS